MGWQQELTSNLPSDKTATYALCSLPAFTVLGPFCSCRSVYLSISKYRGRPQRACSDPEHAPDSWWLVKVRGGNDGGRHGGSQHLEDAWPAVSVNEPNGLGF